MLLVLSIHPAERVSPQLFGVDGRQVEPWARLFSPVEIFAYWKRTLSGYESISLLDTQERQLVISGTHGAA